ncbi:Hypothetical predicted protein, partial [Paramuricea clavata]
KVKELIGDIGKHLTDEKLYKKEDIAEVLNLQPTDSFVKFLNSILSKFKNRKNHNKLLQQFYGKTNAYWEEYFHPCKAQKIVFLMLIHLPERLVAFLEDSQDKSSPKKKDHVSLSSEESGPLYLAGYIICSLYQKSKNCQQCNSARNKEIQALMLCMRVDTEHNLYIASISRGGLWSPHPWIVIIAEACELTFRNSTNEEMITHLPAETMVNEVLSSASVNGLWDNIVENCDIQISKEWKSLCLENFIKLYIRVRCFSFAKDIVQKTLKKKALRKELKK